MTAGQRDLGSVVSLPAHSLRAVWCHYSAAKQSTLGHGTLQSFLNLSLRVSLMREEGGVRQRHGHPQPLPPSHQVGQWRNAAGTRTCLSLLWAPREKGLKPQVLHGNEHCSLCRVGKLMLSQGRVHLSREVRNSPPSPAPQPLPQALRQLCEMEALVEAGWEPPGLLQQTGQCQSQHSVNHQPRLQPDPSSGRSWVHLGTPHFLTQEPFPEQGQGLYNLLAARQSWEQLDS